MKKHSWYVVAVGVGLALGQIGSVAWAAAVGWSGNGANRNWSTSGNWTNGAAPVGVDDVSFFTTNATGTIGPTGNSNNVVSASTHVRTLQYRQTNGQFHTTYIPENVVLTVGTNLSASTVALFVGTAVDSGAAGSNYTTIRGPGTLAISNAMGVIRVRQGGPTGSHRATLDLSGLNTLEGQMLKLVVADDGTTGNDRNFPAGTLLLAKTNRLELSEATQGGAILVAATDQNNGLPSLFRLGQVNVFYADSGMKIGSKKSSARLDFQSGLTSPTAVFRNKAGTGAMAYWGIGDNSAQTSSSTVHNEGTADFTAGSVDAMIGTLYVGRGIGFNAAARTTGTLSFAAGQIAAASADIGAQAVAGTGAAKGTVNVGAGGQFQVATDLRLGVRMSASGGATGALAVAGGTVGVAGSLLDGNDASTVTLTNGTLSVGGSLGVATNPVDVLAMTNSTLQINLSDATNVFVTALETGGSTNRITIMQTPALSSFPTQFVLVKYTGAIGGAGYNFQLGNRTNFPGYLVNNSGNASIDLVLTNDPATAGIAWVGNVNSNWDANTTANWKDIGGSSTVFLQTDFVTFDDTASNATVSLVGSLTPAAIAVSNATLDYTFTGSGRLTGPAGLTKEGAGSLTIANSGVNDFSGPLALNGGALIFNRDDSFFVVNALTGGGALIKKGTGTLSLGGASTNYTGTVGVEGGTLQVGAGGTLGSLSGNITNNSALAFSRSDTATNASIISGTGSVTKLSGNNLVLAGANTYSGPTLVSGGVLILTNGQALGNSSTVTVNNSCTLRLEGDVTVSGRPLVLAGGAVASMGPLQATNGVGTWAGPITILSDQVRVSPLGVSTLVISGVIDSGANAYGLAVRGQIADSVIVLSGSNLWKGTSTVVVGTLKLAGGDNRLPIASSLIIGNAANNNGCTFDLAGQNQQLAGLLHLGTTLPLLVTNSAGSLSTLNLTFDTVSYTNRAPIAGPIALIKGGTGTQTLSGVSTYSGDTTVAAGTLRLGTNNALPGGAGAGNVTVDGALDLGGFSEAINGLNGAATGTVVNATGAGTYTLAVGGGDASGSFSGTIANPSGTIALTKVGAGTQTLGGSNTYAGLTTIQAGTLALGAGGSINGSAGLVIVPGGVLDASGAGGLAIGSGKTLSAGRASAFANDIVGNLTNLGAMTIGGVAQAGTLTVSGGLSLEGGSLAYDLANVTTAGGGVNDLIAIGGPLNLSGTTTINPTFLNGVPAAGTYTLVGGGASVGGSEVNLSLTWPSNAIRQTAYLDTTTTPGSVLMQVSGAAASLVWAGTNGSAWDINTTTNWDNAGVADRFYNYDDVRFTDASTNGAVTVGVAVTPSTVTIDNGSQSYAFSGSGKISGGAAVVKAGAGTATMSLTNDYLGATTITGGVLKLGHVSALGATNAGTFVSGAGTLDLNDLQALGNEVVTIAGSGAGGQGALVNNIPSFTATRGLRFLTLSGDATVGGLGRFDVKNTPTILGNGYTLTKVGTNMVNLDDAGDAGFGDLFVNEGLLQVQGNTTLGSLSNTMTIAAAGTFAAYQSTVTNAKPMAVNGGRILLRNGSMNLGGPMTLSGFATIQVDGTAIGLRGPIGGTGGFVKTGTGALNMYSASNTWGGGALLSAGVVNVFASEALVGNVTNDTAVAFRPASNETLTCSANITGTGTISHTVADATTVLTGTSDVGGGILVGAGELQVGGGSLAGSTLVTAATLRVLAGGAFHAGSLTIGLNAGASTNVGEAGGTETVGSGPAHDLLVGIRSSNVSAPRGVLDVSALGTFTANVGNILVGCGTYDSAQAPPGGTVLLATNNALTATNILIGNVSLGGAYNDALTNDVVLGVGSNAVHTPRLVVGGLKMSARLLLGAGGTLVLDHGEGPADLLIGANEINTGANPKDTLDASAGIFRANLNTLAVARKVRGTYADSGSGSVYAWLLIGSNAANQVTASAINLATVADAVGGGAVGMMFFGGGSLYVSNDIVLSARTGTVGSSRGALHLMGGTAEVAGNLVDGSSAASCLSTVVVDGATLDLQPAGDAVAGVIGTASEPINVLQLLRGTLRNVAEINGGGTVVKDGPGTLVLDGATAYTGPTLVSNGTLLVDCALGAGGVTVEAGTLGGTGSIGGGVQIQAAGTLAPGASIGTLSVSGALTLAGAAVMEANKASGVVTHDRVAGLASVTYGGTLTVTATGQALALGDSLPLFSAASYAGWFSGLTLPAAPDDTAWDTNNLRTNGVLDLYAFTFSTQTLATAKNTAAELATVKLLQKASSSRGAPALVSVSSPSAMTGSVAIVGTNIVYTPPTNYVGADTFTCVLEDGHGTITVTVDVTVTNTDNVSGNILPLSLSGGNVLVRFMGISGTEYILQSATNIVTPPVTWLNRVTNTAPTNGLMSYLDLTATNLYLQYYRTVVP